jgi:hypothetical protein
MKKEEPPEPAQVDLFRLIKETEAKDFVLVVSRQGQQWEGRQETGVGMMNRRAASGIDGESTEHRLTHRGVWQERPDVGRSRDRGHRDGRNRWLLELAQELSAPSTIALALSHFRMSLREWAATLAATAAGSNDPAQSGRRARARRPDACPDPADCRRSQAERLDNVYLRAAQAYMLISMPTGTSAIFGVFQVIRVSQVDMARRNGKAASG